MVEASSITWPGTEKQGVENCVKCAKLHEKNFWSKCEVGCRWSCCSNQYFKNLFLNILKGSRTRSIGDSKQEAGKEKGMNKLQGSNVHKFW